MLVDDGYCFACGPDNPVGLHLKFGVTDDDEKVTVEFTPRREHQGYTGVVHGGILATLADECMAHTLLRRGVWAVTAKLELKYISPAKVGELLRVIGELIEESKRLLTLRCTITSESGKLVAEAEAVFFRQKQEVSPGCSGGNTVELLNNG